MTDHPTYRIETRAVPIKGAPGTTEWVVDQIRQTREVLAKLSEIMDLVICQAHDQDTREEVRQLHYWVEHVRAGATDFIDRFREDDDEDSPAPSEGVPEDDWRRKLLPGLTWTAGDEPPKDENP